MASFRPKPDTSETISDCYHCGEDCGNYPILFDERSFCCSGCRTVYEILGKSNASEYYRLEQHPGKKVTTGEFGTRYAYLDNTEISHDLLEFSENGISKVKLFIPAIHCSACIWLLENLHRFHIGVRLSSVNFIKKEVTITFRDQELSLRQLVELLASINYIPHLALNDLQKDQKRKVSRGIYYRLGVAGFCFGNIMLFSFPSYLSVDDSIEHLLRQNFGLMNILLGIPVAFYAGSGYFVSAFKGLRKGFISIDVPIAFGILVLFSRSVYEILSGTGPGFMDSLGGLVFFLLIGKWYQGKTYQALSFERDYRSYFPVAVTVISDQGEESIISLKKLRTGMRILVRNQELIPADAILVRGTGSIDYSFVTGESTAVFKNEGERIYAGGRQAGASIELIVEKEVAQSRLTELWNQDPAGQDKKTRWNLMVDVLGRYFTIVLLLLATVAGISWWFINPSKAVMVVSAILIVACPCALALTLPFSFGGAMRVFGRYGFYLKRTGVVELLSRVDTVVFDKTGTITRNDDLHIDLTSLDMAAGDLHLIRSLVRQSTHPISVAIYCSLAPCEADPVSNFCEIPAKGIEGTIGNDFIRLGSEEFAANRKSQSQKGNCVYITINGISRGFIRISNRYRDGMEEVLKSLSRRYELHLLSGDNDAELPNLIRFFPSKDHLRFNQSPHDKLQYIRYLKQQGKKVLMIGDGLNDAGALRESDCGISIADNIYLFSLSCDAILESSRFRSLGLLLRFSRDTLRIVKLSITLSFIYNLLGLGFAITGNLTPVISAILMPLSSVSVVGFITLAIFFAGLRFSANRQAGE
ncbi:MAG: heavy metal translocating P-type ATPase metal-binding domain-containing protein [Bacteroidetes bacterium]|nr:heavy metal translocating P-type ATPase metal-binding domain-containing protein [Bacteroidota bacterium]